ncbi:MAG: hypothetical protein M1546_05390 [Chloroflexi bacterium]|nr:hypothetical protein [Chloroflexota bacterium]
MRLLYILLTVIVAARAIPRVYAQTGQPAQPATAKLVLFHSPTCPHCHDVINDILPPIRADYQGRIEIQMIDITFPANNVVYFKFQQRHPGLVHAIPEMVIGDAVLIGTIAIRERLRNEIEACLVEGGCDWSAGVGPVPAVQQNPLTQPNLQPQASATPGADCGPVRGDSTVQSDDIGACRIPVVNGTGESSEGPGILATASAGLLDGMQPYALITIVFLISYLAFVVRKGRDILTAGTAYTVGVFLAYLALGHGLSNVIRQSEPAGIVEGAIFSIAMIVCLVLAIVSVWNYVKIRRGRLGEGVLQNPNGLGQQPHQVVRAGIRVAAAFGAGILVSVFELVCAGQAFRPSISIGGSTMSQTQEVGLLALYNLMFIVPLTVVFALMYLGSHHRRLTTILQTRAGEVKLLAAVLFVFLGGWMIYLVSK